MAGLVLVRSTWADGHAIAPLPRLIFANRPESVWRGLRPLHGACRSRRCQHNLSGLASIMRQCRAARHPRTNRPFRPVRPYFRRCGPTATLLCTDTHSIPQLRWLTPLRSCAHHSTPSRFYRTSPVGALPHGIFRKIEKGRGSALHRADGRASDRKREKFPLYPFLIADLSARYDFDYWKIVENCKNMLSESM